MSCELIINAPSYCANAYDGYNDIYKLCKNIEEKINLNQYIEHIDKVVITPFVSSEKRKSAKKYQIMISKLYRIANVSIHIPLKKFEDADYEEKKSLVLENILKSFFAIKSKLKDSFDYEGVEKEILRLATEE